MISIISNVYLQQQTPFSQWLEKFEYTKGIIRIRKSKKNRQCNGLEKKNKQLQSIYVTISSTIWKSEVAI